MISRPEVAPERRTGGKGGPLLPPAGFTFVEVVVVAMIILMLSAMGVAHFRNTRVATAGMTAAITGQIEARQASDKLKEALLDATEIVKPLEGSTQNFLVVKDILNQLKLFYLEKPELEDDGPFRLVSYVDGNTGSFVPDNRKVLFKKVEKIAFTPLSPGLVIIQVTLLDLQKKENILLIEGSLKNLASVPED